MENSYIARLFRSMLASKKDAVEGVFNAFVDFMLENRDNPEIVPSELSDIVPAIHNLYAQNALGELANGRMFISDGFLNSAALHLANNSSVINSIDIVCYGGGTMDFVVSHQMGKFLIKGDVMECHHDSKSSRLLFCINEKKVVSAGLSQMFASLTKSLAVKFLDKTFNRSLPNGLRFTYAADVITVDFAEYIENLPFNYRVGGRKISDFVAIEKVDVVEGGLELKLKYNLDV